MSCHGYQRRQSNRPSVIEALPTVCTYSKTGDANTLNDILHVTISTGPESFRNTRNKEITLFVVVSLYPGYPDQPNDFATDDVLVDDRDYDCVTLSESVGDSQLSVD
jgi:hypothetical protein